MYPADLKYTTTHEWVKEEKGVASIGLSDHAIKQLSDIVFLELPGVGDNASKGSSFGAIESIKAVFDLNSPVTGQVTEINQALIDNLDILQTDAYEQGWMVKVKLENPEELQDLMDAAAYEAFVKTEENRH